jgi:hypothetical protein
MKLSFLVVLTVPSTARSFTDSPPPSTSPSVVLSVNVREPTSLLTAGNAHTCGTYDFGDAVFDYLANATAAEATYGGPIGEWDVSCVTYM